MNEEELGTLLESKKDVISNIITEVHVASFQDGEEGNINILSLRYDEGDNVVKHTRNEEGLFETSEEKKNV